MRLNLQRIENVRGIYDGKLPERMRYLHPEAAHAFDAIAGSVVVSDMFRSPESSLRAVREGRGAMAPGFSAHNYGLAIDIDVKAAMKQIDTKRTLDNYMRANGWHCHRTDHAMAPECWHYNYLGDIDYPRGIRSTAALAENAIVFWYGQSFELTISQAQQNLLALRMYSGKCDGVAGPLTRESVRVFQRAWGLRETGALDARTRRTLAYVAP